MKERETLLLQVERQNKLKKAKTPRRKSNKIRLNKKMNKMSSLKYLFDSFKNKIISLFEHFLPL
jgi:hypothetical protein